MGKNVNNKKEKCEKTKRKINTNKREKERI